MSSPRIVGTANDENAVSRDRIEAVDRLQEPERGDLDEIVEVLATALIAPGELAGERQEALDERLAGRLVAGMRALQQQPIGARPRGPALRIRWICSRRVCARGSIVEMLHLPETRSNRKVRAGCLGRLTRSGGVTAGARRV